MKISRELVEDEKAFEQICVWFRREVTKPFLNRLAEEIDELYGVGEELDDD
jgi:hypothetical protein